MQSRHTIFILYMLSLFLVGLGYLAIMPAFEGYDEYAYYSSMRQIAATGAVPFLGSSYIDQAYLDYAGPLPYGHDSPPFDAGLTYKKFFDQPDLSSLYQQTYRDQPFSPPFRASDKINWQAQHPPLYYFLMAGVVDTIGSFSLITQIFILRLVSFLITLVGVGMGFLAIEKTAEQKKAILGFLLYPIILPMFFPQFTRIGNDSLCVLLIGFLAYFLSKWQKDEKDSNNTLAIGVTLGLGLLTKAFFVPIALVLALFLYVHIWRDKENIALRPHRIMNLLYMFYPAIFIGGGWYLYSASHLGTISGVDAEILLERGGMIKGLAEHFSLHGLAFGLLQILYTFCWSSTWSLAKFPIVLRTLMVIPIIGIMVFTIRHLKRRTAADFSALPLWLMAGLLLGLLHHVMIGLALNGQGQTPGWYLHILMPISAPLIGIGISDIMKRHFGKQVITILVLLASCLQIIAVWCQFALFTGCATKDNNAEYAFSSQAFCLGQFSVLADHLGVIGMPMLAAIGFGSGLICGIALAVLWRNTCLSSPQNL